MKFFSKQFFLHLLVFLVIEVIFVFLLFREFPETNLLTMIGVLHTSYWIVLIIAAWLRERATLLRQRFLATYLPILYHVGVHIYVSYMAIHEHADEHHDEHSMGWILFGAVALGMLIYIGEYLLHRTMHCDTHHAAAHEHCHDEECEENH